MIVKVLKDKSGELPRITYFKRVAETWMAANIFSTEDAIKYVTTNGNLIGKADEYTGGFNEI